MGFSQLDAGRAAVRVSQVVRSLEGSRGWGRETACQLIAKGHSVYIGARKFTPCGGQMSVSAGEAR